MGSPNPHLPYDTDSIFRVVGRGEKRKKFFLGVVKPYSESLNSNLSCFSAYID